MPTTFSCWGSLFAASTLSDENKTGLRMLIESKEEYIHSMSSRKATPPPKSSVQPWNGIVPAFRAPSTAWAWGKVSNLNAPSVSRSARSPFDLSACTHRHACSGRKEQILNYPAASYGVSLLRHSCESRSPISGFPLPREGRPYEASFGELNPKGLKIPILLYHKRLVVHHCREFQELKATPQELRKGIAFYGSA